MDLDGDGFRDMLSGSWPGELFLFRGNKDGSFGPPEMIKNKAGKIINIGGGPQKGFDGGVLVAGSATFEKKDGKNFIRYQDELIEVKPGTQSGITGTASAVHAVDWDEDGDLDLLVGNIGGSVFLVPNEGSAKQYAFGKEIQLSVGDAAGAGGLFSQVARITSGKSGGTTSGPITVPGGDAGPFAADWDADGKNDLLVGCGDGSVLWFRNVGEKGKPKLAAAVTLVPPGKVEFGPNASAEPTRGIRAKICAADWNGDGRLDLLVGDFTTQKPVRPDPTPEEKERIARLTKERDAAMARYSALYTRLHGSNPPADQAEREKLESEFKTALEQFQSLYKQIPQEYENHGWVWLFERLPAVAPATANE